MGAVPGSLCWKKQRRHLEGAWGHCHTHGGLHPPSPKCPKILTGTGGCCRPALGCEGNMLRPFPWHIPCQCPFNFLFGAIPAPLRPPPGLTIRSLRHHPRAGSRRRDAPKSRIPSGETHGCPCAGTNVTVAVTAAGLGVSLLPSRCRGVCREIVPGEPNK